jgi:hypothetical protein
MLRTKNSLEKKIRCIRASRHIAEMEIYASHGRANPLMNIQEEACIWPLLVRQLKRQATIVVILIKKEILYGAIL